MPVDSAMRRKHAGGSDGPDAHDVVTMFRVLAGARPYGPQWALRCEELMMRPEGTSRSWTPNAWS